MTETEPRPSMDAALSTLTRYSVELGQAKQSTPRRRRSGLEFVTASEHAQYTVFARPHRDMPGGLEPHPELDEDLFEYGAELEQTCDEYGELVTSEPPTGDHHISSVLRGESPDEGPTVEHTDAPDDDRRGRRKAVYRREAVKYASMQGETIAQMPDSTTAPQDLHDTTHESTSRLAAPSNKLSNSATPPPRAFGVASVASLTSSSVMSIGDDHASQKPSASPATKSRVPLPQPVTESIGSDDISIARVPSSKAAPSSDASPTFEIELTPNDTSSPKDTPSPKAALSPKATASSKTSLPTTRERYQQRAHTTLPLDPDSTFLDGVRGEQLGSSASFGLFRSRRRLTGLHFHPGSSRTRTDAHARQLARDILQPPRCSTNARVGMYVKLDRPIALFEDRLVCYRKLRRTPMWVIPLTSLEAMTTNVTQRRVLLKPIDRRPVELVFASEQETRTWKDAVTELREQCASSLQDALLQRAQKAEDVSALGA